MFAVHNAGIGGGDYNIARAKGLETGRRFWVNVGVMLFTQYAARQMQARGGRIVNTALLWRVSLRARRQRCIARPKDVDQLVT